MATGTTSVPPAIPPRLGGLQDHDTFLGTAGGLAVLVSVVLACRFAVPWARVSKGWEPRPSNPSKQLASLPADVSPDDEARWASRMASPAAQLRSFLAAAHQGGCQADGISESQLYGSPSLTTMRQGITPAAQLRKFTPGSLHVGPRPRDNAFGGDEPDPLAVQEDMGQIDGSILAHVEPEVQGEAVSGHGSPKSAGFGDVLDWEPGKKPGGLGCLPQDVSLDDGARWASRMASPAAQLRSFLAAAHQGGCQADGISESQLYGSPSLTTMRQGITPAAQLRKFTPGSLHVEPKPRDHAFGGGEPDPLAVQEDMCQTDGSLLAHVEPEVQGEAVSGHGSPKSGGFAASATEAPPAVHIREIRSCLAVRQQRRAELESRVAEFVQSEDLLGSIMKNEKSERQLEQHLADVAKRGGVECSPKHKPKRPYMLSVALNSMPVEDNGLKNMDQAWPLPGQCE